MIYKDYVDGICSEGAVNAVGNRYDLILIAARRTRELNAGWSSHIQSEHSNSITALLEIQEGKVDKSYLHKEQNFSEKRYKKHQK